MRNTGIIRLGLSTWASCQASLNQWSATGPGGRREGGIARRGSSAKPRGVAARSEGSSARAPIRTRALTKRCARGKPKEYRGPLGIVAECSSL